LLKSWMKILPLFITGAFARKYCEKFSLEVAGERWIVVNPWDDVIFIVNRKKI